MGYLDPDRLDANELEALRSRTTMLDRLVLDSLILQDVETSPEDRAAPHPVRCVRRDHERWETMIHALEETAPQWESDTKNGYHMVTFDWIIAALLSSFGFAVVSITDKVIMSGMGLRVRGFLLFIGFQSLVVALVITALNPFPASIDAAVYVRGFVVGLMWGAGAALMLWTLSREEVSRVAPIFQSYPLLVVIFAVVLLGESLTGLESLAAALAIGGAILAAAKLSAAGGIHFGSAFAYLAVAMVVIALAQILLKTVTNDLSFWHASTLRSAGIAVVLIPMNLRPVIARDLVRFMTVPKSLFALVVDAAVAVVSMILITFAISAGPVSLVHAVISTSPLIVFFGSTIVAWKTKLLLQETLTRSAIVQKLVATSMVVSGLTLLAIG
jgi:drug/metabolite transporter (DMT)-like permease